MESNAYGDEEAVVSQKGALERTTWPVVGRPEVGREDIRAQTRWWKEGGSAEVIPPEIIRARRGGTEGDGPQALWWP